MLFLLYSHQSEILAEFFGTFPLKCENGGAKQEKTVCLISEKSVKTVSTAG